MKPNANETILSLSPSSFHLLLWGFPFPILCGIRLWIELLSCQELPANVLLNRYYPYLEHIIMGATVLLGGALLLEYIEKSKDHAY